MPRTEVFNRREVLNKAKNIFWLKGYNGTSMQDLVDVTGLNRSSIYNSFGSKMELYMQTLKRYQGDIGELFEKANRQDRNAIETIGLVFLYVLEDILDDTEEKGCMLINCQTEMGNQDAQLHGLLGVYQERLAGIFQNWVIRGQAEGTIRTDEKSELLSYYLVNAYQGLRLSGMNTKDAVILKSIIQNILKTITH